MAKEAQTAARKLRIFKLPVSEGAIDAPSIENLSPVAYFVFLGRKHRSTKK
jgi:hypothetical protein